MLGMLGLDLSFGFLSRCSSSVVSVSKLRRLLRSDENLGLLEWLEDCVGVRCMGLSLAEWLDDCDCARSIGLSNAAESARTSSFDGALSASE
jgi:hypothetical protein